MNCSNSSINPHYPESFVGRAPAELVIDRRGFCLVDRAVLANAGSTSKQRRPVAMTLTWRLMASEGKPTSRDQEEQIKVPLFVTILCEFPGNGISAGVRKKDIYPVQLAIYTPSECPAASEIGHV